MFCTLTKLTKSHDTVDPYICITLTSDNLKSFFHDKILTIRDQMNCLLSSLGTNLFTNTEHLERGVRPDTY